MRTLVIATRNRHKVEEIRSILGPGFRYLTLNDFAGAPEVVEDAGTFAGNASKKALGLAEWLSRSAKGFAGELVVLADDSGLEVAALEGAPGVNSARFAALDSGGQGNSSTADNNAKLLRLLAGVPAERRQARFRCVLAIVPVAPRGCERASPVCYADELELALRLFEGSCEGRVIDSPQGEGGFGYDPLFVPDGCQNTFGQLPESVKNSLSHRARALAGLKAALEH